MVKSINSGTNESFSSIEDTAHKYISTVKRVAVMTSLNFLCGMLDF